MQYLMKFIVLFSCITFVFPRIAKPGQLDVPVLVKIVTNDKHLVIGELINETDSQIELVELTKNEPTAIPRDQIRQVRINITENEAAQSIGLGNVLAWKVANIIPRKPSAAHIIKIDQATVYVSLGSNVGAKPGQELRVYRGEAELKDPITGEVLGRERRLIARLILTEVRERFSKARAQGDLEIPFEVGDVVEPINTNNMIVVLPFLTVDGRNTTRGNLLAEELTTALVRRSIGVVERSQFSRALAELLLQNTLVFDAEKAQKIGRQLGAYAALLGTLSLKDKATEANVRLVEIETGRILFAGEYSIYNQSSSPQSVTIPPSPPVSTEAIGRGSPSLKEAGVSSPTARFEATKADPRSRWFGETYDITICHLQGKQWHQIDNKTQKVSARLTETARAPEYVELSGFNFGVGRLYSERLVMKKGERWEWVCTGRWIAPLEGTASSRGDRAGGVGPSRTEYINTTYGGRWRHAAGKQWIELNHKKEIVCRFTEVARNEEYVEIHRQENTPGQRANQLRLYSDHVKFKNGDKWEWVANGQWSTQQ